MAADVSAPPESSNHPHAYIRTHKKQIQKVVPGTLEALSEAISEQPTLSLYKDGALHKADTSHVAFFLISDIGWVT